jgi:hypothetical protein
MESGCHWFTALAEVYARHAARHGPHRLLPAAVLPAHGRVPGHGGASPPGASPDGRMAEPSTPKSAHDTDRCDEGACDDTRHETRVGP